MQRPPRSRRDLSLPINANGLTKSIVRQMINSKIRSQEEIKYNSVSVVSAAQTTTPIFLALTAATTQGVGANARVGDRIKVLKLKGNVFFYIGDATNVGRLTIIRWKMDDGSDAPTLAEIYATSVPSRCPVDIPVPTKFDVLFDQIVYISTTDPVKRIVFDLDFKNGSDVEYNAAGVTGYGNLYSILSSDSGAAAHPTATLDYAYSFTDS